MLDSHPIQRYRAKYILNDLNNDLTFIENGAIDIQNGKILAVHHQPSPDYTIQTTDLGNVALIPGMINTHSHSFQRAIRGRTEYRSAAHLDDNFWSWRQQMYDAALTFSPEQVHAAAALTFLEMLMAGITTVGEFHYLHHQPDGTPYADPNELAHRVIAAAEHVGIRIALLRVAYNRAGFQKTTDPRQRRFIEPDIDTYLHRFENLQKHHHTNPLVTVGLAPHSIRAVPRTWLASLADYNATHNLPLHIHACEQRVELTESQAEYNLSPIELLADLGLLGPKTTLVHATHLSPADLDLMQANQPTVCACPTTERNLGDGFLPALELTNRNIPIALGSDSQANIDPFEEMRLTEYHERLRLERRNILSPQPANTLFPMATQNGTRALALNTGKLQPGHHADFSTINLDHITLIGTTPQTLLTDLTLSTTPAAIHDVFVAGRQLIHNGHHKNHTQIIANYRHQIR